MNFCSECGEELPTSSVKFCPYCGAKLLVQQYERQKPKAEAQTGLDLSKLPEYCPICTKKMEKGYMLLGDGGLHWSKAKNKWTATHGEHIISFRILGITKNFINIETLRCPNCKIILFSYEKGKWE